MSQRTLVGITNFAPEQQGMLEKALRNAGAELFAETDSPSGDAYYLYSTRVSGPSLMAMVPADRLPAVAAGLNPIRVVTPDGVVG